MLSSARRSFASPARLLLRLLALLVLALSLLPAAVPARAEGGRNMSGTSGYRAHLEFHATATSGGIPRQTTIKAFARAGESIYIGSSAMGVGAGDVVIRAPTDTAPATLWPIAPGAQTCRARAGANPAYGRIQNLAQEQAGAAPAAGGYTPCVITPAETQAAGDGIWEFDFISPNPDTGLPIPSDPTPIRTDVDWANPPRPSDSSGHWINAWDVSVRDTDAGDANGNVDVEVPGRVFANYLALNLGGNASTSRPDIGLASSFYIQTVDGYGYLVDMNGVDPFAFVFFANAEGIVDQSGNSIYRSIQLAGTNADQQPPTDANGRPIFRTHNPARPDDAANRDITHKIFFNTTGPVVGPDPTMPETAPSPRGVTWLLRPPVTPPAPTSVSYVGEEGTPGQGGTNPLGGYFTFAANAPAGATYQITLDLDGDGVFGNPNADPARPTDRILRGPTEAGANRVYWDGLDGANRKVPAGQRPFSVQLVFLVGEVHFPFIDAENNPNGIRLSRVVDPNLPGEPDSSLIYYDDEYNFRAGVPYDWSLCDGDDTPPPPSTFPINTPRCYGQAIDARSARQGTPSIIPTDPRFPGAHRWTTASGVLGANGYGDRRLIDTWTYYPSSPASYTGVVNLAEAELSIAKSHTPPQLTPGGPITYSVVVSNGGPSPATGARVRDTVPPEVLGVTWTCAVTRGTGRCGAASGTGNLIETTVDLAPNSDITYTIVGTVSPDTAQPIVNTASVRRPNDTTDPNPTNNDAVDVAPIVLSADLELNKTLVSPPPLVVGGELEFSIALRNRGPAGAGNVSVSERLPAGLTFVRATPSKGSYDQASGVWTVGQLARDEVATLGLRARWDGTPVANTAEVRSSDRPDPDSTPGNGIPTEDDQSSVRIPPSVADLELRKSVNTPRVNVGQNATFTLELLNRGPDGATNVHVGDRLPIGLSFVKATPSQGSYDPVSGDWNVGSLASGARATLAIEVTVLGPGPFTNAAEVSRSDQFDPDSTPNNGNPREDDQDFATLAGDIADLSLAKRVNNPTPNINEVIVYTVVLENAGPSGATGVQVTDRIPAGIEYVSHTTSQGSYDQASGLWTVGSVPRGGSATLTISGRVRSFSRVVNTAEVTAADQPDPDSRPGNNIPTEDDQASAPLTPRLADLELRKAASTARPALGSNFNFTIALTNQGPSAATGVRVTDRLPVGLSYVGHTTTPPSTTYDPVSGVWNVGLIEVGEVYTLTLTVRMDRVGPLTNSAEVTNSDQFDPDSTPGNGQAAEDDQSSATVSSPVADLSVSKRASSPRPNTLNQIAYTVGVHNAGPDPATGVVVGERLPAGSTLVSAAPGRGTTYANGAWTVGNLAVGETVLLELTVQLPTPAPAGGYVNVAQVTASDLPDPDSTPNNNLPTEDDQASVTVPTGVIDLELDKGVVALSKLDRGALFVLDLTNKGPDPATGVVVEDKLPAGLSFESASATIGSYDAATGLWTVGNLGVNQTARLLIAVRIVAADNARIANFAQVARANEHDVDSTPNNRPQPPPEGQPQVEDDEDAVYFSLLTPVTLKSLTATPTAAGVRIAWQTGAEFDTAGFYLYRATGANRAMATRVTSSLLAARGGGTEGASYSFVDAGAAPGTTYTYWLAEVSRGGAVAEYGPITVTALRPQVWLPVVRGS